MDHEQFDEARLIADARAGDERAYAAIVRRHTAVAFRVAYAIVRDSGEAEDAAQEAFVKAHRALGRFRRDAAFRPWLLKIVANEARNRVRRRGRQARLAMRAGLHPPAASSEELALDAIGAAELRAAVDRLAAPQRDVVVCRYLLGLSVAETAAAIGIREGTVKSRTARALDRLAVLLAGDAP